MQRVLGKKQCMENDQWVRALREIRSLVTEGELSKLESETLKRAESELRGRQCVYAWSGGKDGSVCADLSIRLGVESGSFVHSNLEYPAFLDWALQNLPKGCKPVCTGQDLAWLSKHQSLLFPKNSSALGRTYDIVQHSGNRKRAAELGAQIIISGRRKADGNCAGVAGYYDIIYDWPHEAVLAYHAYRNVPFAPIYGWPDGFRQGTHSWPFRYAKGKTDADMWAEVYAIDPSIVRNAASVLPGAGEFLASVCD